MRRKLPLNPTWTFGQSGPLAHAVQRIYDTDTGEYPICGVRRYHFYPSVTRIVVDDKKCIRCLRLLGLDTPELSGRSHMLHTKLQDIHTLMREEAKTMESEKELDELERKLRSLQAKVGNATLPTRRPTPPTPTYDERWIDVAYSGDAREASLAYLVQFVLGEEPDPRLSDFLVFAEGDECAHLNLSKREVRNTPNYPRLLAEYQENMMKFKACVTQEIAQCEKVLCDREARKAKDTLAKERAEYERLKAKFERAT